MDSLEAYNKVVEKMGGESSEAWQEITPAYLWSLAWQAATEQGVVPVSNPDLCPICKDRQVIPDEDWCGPCREEFYDTVMGSGDTDSPAEQGVSVPNEHGKNRYGLDMAYFRKLFNRELNRPLVDFRPDELARVLARASRTADSSVLLEPEFQAEQGVGEPEFQIRFQLADGTARWDEWKMISRERYNFLLSKQKPHFQLRDIYTHSTKPTGGGVPDGYVLVPKHATKEMLKLGKSAHMEEFLFHVDPDLNIQQIWKAMVEVASQQPPEQESSHARKG